MVSKLKIDTLIRQYIYLGIKSYGLYEMNNSIITHWDCQDTDDDNSTECYFYVPNDIDKYKLDLVKRNLADILCVDVESAIIEDQTNDGNPEIRIEFIVEIGDRNGRKFE